MRVLECNEDNNSCFLCDIINSMPIDKTKYIWVVSDLDLVPILKGDYSGIGADVSPSIAFDFLKKNEMEKVSIINSQELSSILEDTRVINHGVFICIDKKYSIDVNTYRPKVECDNTEEMYDIRAEYEIRILDGDLFFILEKKRN